MPVIGMSIKSIQAAKTGKIEKGLKVNNQTNVSDVVEGQLSGIGKNGLKIKFEYTTTYTVNNNKIGEIKMTGEVMYVGDDVEAIKSSWQANKKLPENTDIQVINHILRRGVTKSLSLSEELQLPPPIALPFASKKKPTEENRYIG